MEVTEVEAAIAGTDTVLVARVVMIVVVATAEENVVLSPALLATSPINRSNPTLRLRRCRYIARLVLFVPVSKLVAVDAPPLWSVGLLRFIGDVASSASDNTTFPSAVATTATVTTHITRTVLVLAIAAPTSVTSASVTPLNSVALRGVPSEEGLISRPSGWDLKIAPLYHSLQLCSRDVVIAQHKTVLKIIVICVKHTDYLQTNVPIIFLDSRVETISSIRAKVRF